MPEDIHILHIETGRHLYGGGLQVLYLMRGLAQNGCRNTLVCPSGSDIAKAAPPGAQIFRVPVRGELDALFMLRLCRIISATQPDLVHVHSRRGADIWGAAAAWCTHTPAIITRRVDNPESPYIARIKYRILQPCRDHIRRYPPCAARGGNSCKKDRVRARVPWMPSVLTVRAHQNGSCVSSV